MEKYRVMRFTAKQLMAAGYSGPQGGVVKGAFYAIYENGKGFVSLDKGRTAYMLPGKQGKESMESIIKAGGFVGEVSYRKAI